MSEEARSEAAEANQPLKRCRRQLQQVINSLLAVAALVACVPSPSQKASNLPIMSYEVICATGGQLDAFRYSTITC